MKHQGHEQLAKDLALHGIANPEAVWGNLPPSA
jgi:hypothetical protein